MLCNELPCANLFISVEISRTKLPSSAELCRADLSHCENFTNLTVNGRVAGLVRPVTASVVKQRKNISLLVGVAD